MRRGILMAAMVLTVLVSGTMVFGETNQQGEKDEGLAALMEKNHKNLETAVQTAYLDGVENQLQEQDYQKIDEAVRAIADVAQQAKQNYSQGDAFDAIAGELQEHAEKAGSAAAEQNHPEVNVEIGEMAEYCAACHQEFRW